MLTELPNATMGKENSGLRRLFLPAITVVSLFIGVSAGIPIMLAFQLDPPYRSSS